MEVDRERRLAAMGAALCCDEDESCAPKRLPLWMKDWMCRKECGMQNQLYEERLDSDPEEYRRLLCVSRKHFLQLLSRVAGHCDAATNSTEDTAASHSSFSCDG
ncbi:uncharacterized protein ISCGN_028113 [Ixodes scapularis]